MSLRALGRQFVAHTKHRNVQVWGGTKTNPQGRLFLPHQEKFRLDRPTIEAGRRRMAGEKNPDAPWEKGRIFQHHFQEHVDPKTGRKVKRVHEQGTLL